MADSEGYKEDVVSLPTGRDNQRSDFGFDGKPSADGPQTKFDLGGLSIGSGSNIRPEEPDIPAVSDPGPSTKFDVNLTFAPNDFPRDKGSVSLSDEEVVLS